MDLYRGCIDPRVQEALLFRSRPQPVAEWTHRQIALRHHELHRRSTGAGESGQVLLADELEVIVRPYHGRNATP